MTHDSTTMNDIDELELTAAYGSAVTVIGSRRSSIDRDRDEAVTQTMHGGGPAAADDDRQRRRRHAIGKAA